jgi:hypothetical protein
MDAHESEAAESPEDDGKVDLLDIIVVEKREGDDVRRLEFQVIQLVEDEDGNDYAVAYCEPEDEFVVTRGDGRLLEDQELAQEILDEFLVLAEESEIPEP